MKSNISWGAILGGLGLFFFFLILFFPLQNLKGRIFSAIHSSTGVTIAAESIYLSLFGWPGVGMKDVEVSIPLASGELELSAKKVVARVGIGSLFPPAPSISLDLSGLKDGGSLFVRVTRGTGFIKGKIDAQKLSLKQVHLAALPEPMQGTISLEGNFYVDEKQMSKSTGVMSLRAEKFLFPALSIQGFILPKFDLSSIVMDMHIKNGSVEIVRSQLGDPKGDFQGKFSGDLKLQNSFQQSILNLTVNILLSDPYRADPNNATIVAFLASYERRPGDYAMKWNSSIEGMTTNVMNALPQKSMD